MPDRVGLSRSRHADLGISASRNDESVLDIKSSQKQTRFVTH